MERALEAADAAHLVDEDGAALGVGAEPGGVERAARVAGELGAARPLVVVGEARGRVGQQRVHLVEDDGHVVARGGAGHVRVAPLLQRPVRRLDLRLRRRALHAEKLVQVVVRDPRPADAATGRVPAAAAAVAASAGRRRRFGSARVASPASSPRCGGRR